MTHPIKDAPKLSRRTIELKTEKPFHPDVKRLYYPSNWDIKAGNVKCPECGAEMPVLNTDHAYYPEFGVWDQLITHCEECCKDRILGYIKYQLTATIELSEGYSGT